VASWPRSLSFLSLSNLGRAPAPPRRSAGTRWCSTAKSVPAIRQPSLSEGCCRAGCHQRCWRAMCCCRSSKDEPI
jgi:hypothetical protein